MRWLASDALCDSQVVVLTRAHGSRAGVRHMTRGLKVYYAPRVAVFGGTTLPGVAGLAPLLRCIVLRERISLVHGHTAFSALANEALLHARTLGCSAVFTDHSLFGFADAPSILTNKTLQFTLADTTAVICVSHTSKQNTVLRATVSPQRVSVVPNAVDAVRFTPDVAMRSRRITIVCMSRLVYRKGVDLLAAVVPLVCAACPEVDFLVGGDGPKRDVLLHMLAQHPQLLSGRVTLLGDVAHEDVWAVLRRGHIFLSASLTESFGIAVLEAACCGMLVVATAVGGVPEVLPPSIMRLAPAEADALADACISAASECARAPPGAAWAQHEAVKGMYSWIDVAERVEAVYDKAALAASQSTPLGRLRRYARTGPFSGLLFAAVAAANALLMCALAVLQPAEEMDIAPDLDWRQAQRLIQSCASSY